jgi:TetR/AcrR family transcriptional regulator, fatty acid metabolism regulator protein
MTKKKLRKQQIMQAAVEVFGRSTYQNANISEIARTAGIAEGTICQYFKNKQDLFFSIGAERTKDFCREIDLNLEGVTGTVDRIRKLVWYYLYYFKTNPDYVRSLMLEMRVSRDFVKSRSYRGFRTFSKQVMAILKEGQAEGIIRSDVDVHLARHLLLGTLEHVVTRWLLKSEKYDVLKCHEQISELILRGICLETEKENGTGSGASDEGAEPT